MTSAQPCRPVATRGGALPTVIVIGAQKCGTSALHYYFGLHPGACVSRPKELDFFLAEKNWTLGVDWYRARFDARREVRVDASPNYTAYPMHRGVFDRMAAVVPDARLIYIVRDPIERIAAHWVHNLARGRHSAGDVAKVILAPKASYVSRSCYALQLGLVREHYPARNILVLDQQELLTDRSATLARVFAFAGLDPDFRHPDFASERNRTRLKRLPTPVGSRWGPRLPPRVWRAMKNRWPMSAPIELPDLRRELPAETMELLRADARAFGELTGRDLSHWSLWRD